MPSLYSVNSLSLFTVVSPRLRILEFPVNFGFTRNAESEAAGLRLRVLRV